MIMLELFPNVIVASCLSLAVAVLCRELFADRVIHWAGRTLGLSGWMVLACYCWALVAHMQAQEKVPTFSDAGTITHSHQIPAVIAQTR